MLNYGSARCVHLPDGRQRMYLYCRHELTETAPAYGPDIISATCSDGIGLVFTQDAGVRIPCMRFPLSAPIGTSYTPDVMWCTAEQYYRMYFSAWTDEPPHGPRGYIFAATSWDGLKWELSNHKFPVMYPGGKYDRVKVREL
eukprot:SAG22_NODE_115_length_19315_cov_10.458368_3_plen_142_part_00